MIVPLVSDGGKATLNTHQSGRVCLSESGLWVDMDSLMDDGDDSGAADGKQMIWGEA